MSGYVRHYAIACISIEVIAVLWLGDRRFIQPICIAITSVADVARNVARIKMNWLSVGPYELSVIKRTTENHTTDRRHRNRRPIRMN